MIPEKEASARLSLVILRWLVKLQTDINLHGQLILSLGKELNLVDAPDFKKAQINLKSTEQELKAMQSLLDVLEKVVEKGNE